jgi:hypothetical protein
MILQLVQIKVYGIVAMANVFQQVMFVMAVVLPMATVTVLEIQMTAVAIAVVIIPIVVAVVM